MTINSFLKSLFCHAVRISDYIFWFMMIVFIVFSVIRNQVIDFINEPSFSFRTDYLIHFLGYSLLVCIAAIKVFAGKGNKASLGLRILLILVIAILTEVIQYYLPWRKFNFLDILMNVSGTVAGISLTLFILHYPGAKRKIIHRHA